MEQAAALSAAQLQQIVQATLQDYGQRAAQFEAGTRDHDVRQNLDALLRHIEATPPCTILDLGCGPGRDLLALRRRGHHAIGLDGTPAFVQRAREVSGCEVWQQDFLHLELPPERFDGIYANAALFHVPTQELPRVLAELRGALKPGGVLFSSNPHGDNVEGWNRGRYGAYHDPARWRALLAQAGFAELEHYYRPAGLPRAQQPWLATVWRRPHRGAAAAAPQEPPNQL
jgi:SAM-dependent methyltransferase